MTRRLLGLTAALMVVLVLLVPAALAADSGRVATATPIPHTGRVLISIDGNVALPAGEQADAVIVIRGTATIGGQVQGLVVIDGSAILSGAQAETILAIRSPITLETGTVVSGDVLTVDSTVTQTGGATVTGSVRDLAVDFTWAGLVIGPLVLLWLFGMAIAAIAAALLLAALAARQVRAAEQLISKEPLSVLGAGFLGIVLPIVIAIPLILTVVGAPLALAMLLGLWPLTAFLGYLVAAIWIGDWLLARFGSGTPRERPYLAAVIGVIVMELMSLLPPLAMIASFFGFGAVLLLAWRAFRSGQGTTVVTSPSPSTPAAAAPMAS